MRFAVFVAFLSVAVLCHAQRTATVSAEYTYYAPDNLTLEQAKQKAVQRAMLEAIAAEFGTLVQQMSTTSVTNADGKSFVGYSSLGSSDVRGEWIRTIGQPEFDTAELFEDEILMQMNPKYLPAEKKEYRPLSQEQADIMCAKHILWLNDAGGEQADFSGYELSDLNLSHRNLNSALFNGAFLYGTSFQESYLCFADFSGAEIQNCNARNIAADEAVFKNAVVRNCDFSGAFMEHCNFSGADLTGTAVNNARMQNACIDGATVPDTVFEQADFRNYSTDEQDWSEPSDPVLSM